MIKGLLLSLAILASLVLICISASALANERGLFFNDSAPSVEIKNHTSHNVIVNGTELTSGENTQPVTLSHHTKIKFSGNTTMLKYNAAQKTLALTVAATSAPSDDCLEVNGSTMSAGQHQTINVTPTNPNPVKLSIVSCAE